MTTPRKHAKVESLKTERNTRKAQLYRGDNPIYAPDVHNEKMSAIETDYSAALISLMEEAQQRYDDAAARLSKVDRPYEWLTVDELAQAAALAPFVREDMAAVDAADLVNVVKSAANAGRVERWLTWRYATRRAAELDASYDTALGMGQRAHFERGVTALRDSVILPSQLKERQKAAAELADAQTLADAAEWAQPATRQSFAVTMGVDAQYLPD